MLLEYVALSSKFRSKVERAVGTPSHTDVVLPFHGEDVY